MSDKAETVFGWMATSTLKDLLRTALVKLARRGLATLDDLALLDELEDQRQPQPLAA